MIDGLILAFQFLTRIPIPIAIDFNEKNHRISNLYYGAVGLVLGGIYFSVYFLMSDFDPWIRALLITFLMAGFTGGLHLDGVSDTADGFFCGKSKEESYNIMKDSRVGTFGVLALFFLLSSKLIFIAKLSEPVALITAAANARFAVPIFFVIGKSPSDKGLGSLEQKSVKPLYAIFPAVLYLSVLVIKKPIGAVSFLAVLFYMVVLRNMAYNKIGGVSGDIYGAFIEISEALTLLIFILMKSGGSI